VTDYASLCYWVRDVLFVTGFADAFADVFGHVFTRAFPAVEPRLNPFQTALAVLPERQIRSLVEGRFAQPQ